MIFSLRFNKKNSLKNGVEDYGQDLDLRYGSSPLRSSDSVTWHFLVIDLYDFCCDGCLPIL
ncbi:hypothetical protein SGQ44_13315 [Flavobacterium sp. Fl-77]|uniref:Uncharacterized protein n=1 Tax=Flavobacterium flavipigmentatum TaxID=2893884 RepID=A0AAJ2SF79_9FLAO|nr:MULTISPECIES: hypothetical protein [unclassified Flavobacterium]MDX6183458.1 hypothetical protein [Flavobacterium sp. Fl-33]MDX6186742.1 hypothetical protein [Flavobacterium sp. Fl-77]UFH38491.1 hypothetical protein LNP22_17410 [Flavobacterium sp. F-70]